ncbi:MAG TPA: DUF461 domain-containing protein [Streptomyces sp.]|nr:DUF461 domain-containing protein [Streptomyces sp.]
MSSSIRRGTLAATALALAVATLSACAAGRDAQTLEIKPDNAATSIGHVKIQNVNIVTASASGASAVTARIFNDSRQDETLKSVTVKGAGARVKLSPAQGEKAMTVPAGGSLALGGKGNASAVLLEAGSGAVKDGNAQQVSFDLSRTGTVSLRATVVPTHGDYKKYGPTVQPSPSAPSGTASASPSDGASESASPGETDGANAENAEESAKHSPSASESHAAGH